MSKLKQLFLDTSLFRLSYMLCLFFCMVMYVYIPSYAILCLLFVWGAALTIYTVVKKKTYSKLYLSLWIVLFAASFVITILFNISSDIYAVLYNVVMLLHIGICFFVFYGMHTENTVPFRWELYLIARVFVYLSTVFSLIGLVMMLFTSGRFDNYMYYEGVFKGFYINPNYQGYVSVLSIIFCHMLTKPNFILNSMQKRVSRIWIVTCILINCIALLLCDSNASLLFIIVYAAVYVLMKLFAMNDNLTPKKMVIRGIVLILIGIVVLSIMMFVRVFCRVGVTAVFSEKGLTAAEIKELSSDAVFIPNKDSGFTSRTFLWGAGWKLFLSAPIFGIGKGSLLEGIIAVTGRTNFNNDFDGVFRMCFTDLHSGYLSVLVHAGIIGFILFAVFMVRYFMMIFPVWFLQRRIMTHSVYPCLLSYIIAYFVFSFVERTMLFDVTFFVMTFWLFIGYTACYALDFGYMRRGNVYIFNKKLHKKYI
ncbi:MAG: O-antigen ligase family protein [Ruminococcus sp.]|nr:O-antigen ligase family protein [Ruminococcus sp.]